MREHYQTMMAREKQTGNEADDDPLRPFLIAAFTPFKEAEPDYVASNRKGGVRCKPTEDIADEGDDSDDPDVLEAVATSKKNKKIRVKGIQHLLKTLKDFQHHHKL